MEDNGIRATVRRHYASIARQPSSCCSPAPACCSGETASRLVSYSQQELAQLPAGADLGLGCGNPTALASLEPGEVVVDLGSGAGIDCFLAAQRVGPDGRVIGVDMTHEMLERSRRAAVEGGFANVEFRLGEIESLPVADCTADVVISNCVINLSTDKPRVFREAFRVLRPSGRLMVSDIVLARPLPERVRRSVEAYAGCISGALLVDDYLTAIREAGFVDVEVVDESGYAIGSSNPDASELAALSADGITVEDIRAAADAVRSVQVRARRPDDRS
jgi:SAM-dependent methyltransferase